MEAGDMCLLSGFSVAVCCSVCSTLQFVAVGCSVSWCVCCRVLQSAAGCCKVLQCVAGCFSELQGTYQKGDIMTYPGQHGCLSAVVSAVFYHLYEDSNSSQNLGSYTCTFWCLDFLYS